MLSFNACFALLLVSMWLGWFIGTIVAATGIAVIAAWHGAAMLSVLRERLASRFVVVALRVRGSILCVTTCSYRFHHQCFLLPFPRPSSDADLTFAHALSGVSGWLGLSIGGTAINCRADNLAYTDVSRCGFPGD